jgi:hypothetical protein
MLDKKKKKQNNYRQALGKETYIKTDMNTWKQRRE